MRAVGSSFRIGASSGAKRWIVDISGHPLVFQE